MNLVSLGRHLTCQLFAPISTCGHLLISKYKHPGVVFRSLTHLNNSLLTASLPGAFERACAARQLACLASQLTHPAMSDAVRYLLPALLSVIDDPAAAVSRYGLVAMCHLVKESLPSGEITWRHVFLQSAIWV